MRKNRRDEIEKTRQLLLGIKNNEEQQYGKVEADATKK